MHEGATISLISERSGSALAVSLEEQADRFASASRASATKRAYSSDWGAFTTWCAPFGFSSLPASPETVALYLAHLASIPLKPSTIGRALVAISQAHKLAGHPSPRDHARVVLIMGGIRRTLGTAPRQVHPMTADVLRRVMRALPETAIGVRDRAMLLVGFAAALRRSELVALDVSDVRLVDDGLEITVRRSKTDQEGAGRVVGVPFGSKAACPVRAFRAWLDRSAVVEGPVFRAVDRHGRIGEQRLSDRAVAIVVKRAADLVGLDAEDFAGHSLRAGLATSAARAGKGLDTIMRQTGHRSERVARGYIRHASLFDVNAAEGIL